MHMETTQAAAGKKHLAVVTGTRAEYGLLRPVIKKLLKSDKIIPDVIVTGAHLRAEYGHTVEEILADGIRPAAEIDILRFGSGPLALPDTVAYALQAFARWFAAQRPAAVLLLGDRYEIFAAAQAAAMISKASGQPLPCPSHISRYRQGERSSCWATS